MLIASIAANGITPKVSMIGLAELLAHGTKQLLAVSGRLPAVAPRTAMTDLPRSGSGIGQRREVQEATAVVISSGRSSLQRA